MVHIVTNLLTGPGRQRPPGVHDFREAPSRRKAAVNADRLARTIRRLTAQFWGCQRTGLDPARIVRLASGPHNGDKAGRRTPNVTRSHDPDQSAPAASAYVCAARTCWRFGKKTRRIAAPGGESRRDQAGKALRERREPNAPALRSKDREAAGRRRQRTPRTGPRTAKATRSRWRRNTAVASRRIPMIARRALPPPT
jgi:hypothetical protein